MTHSKIDPKPQHEVLIIEKILPVDNSLNVQLQIRRELTTDEKISNIKTLIRSNKYPQYTDGKVAFMLVDLRYIDEHNVVIGDNINDYDDIKYKMMTLESTNKNVFDEEAVTYKVKINPKTNKPMKHKGNKVYHATFLISESAYTGDVLLKND